MLVRTVRAADEGADTLCQLGNLTLSNAVTMDWLKDILGGRE